MQRDFTIKRYIELLNALSNQGFSFLAFSDLRLKPEQKTVILRHDVDKLPESSLAFAEIQSDKGIKGTYYFRIVPESFDEKIIKEISSLGHEIGYHYEDLSFAQAKLKAQGTGHRAQGEEVERMVVNIGIELFKKNLEKLRRIVPVKTICMHGSPMSRWDSRLLWKYYDYHDFGIIGEPYFDINFDEVLYLTDTGRRWDGEAVSIRDRTHDTRRMTQKTDFYYDWKVKPVNFRSKSTKDKISPSRPPALAPSSYRFHSTSDIIKAAKDDKLPDKIMMTFHPQRWTDKPMPWVKELVWQNVKNVGKYFVVRMRGER